MCGESRLQENGEKGTFGADRKGVRRVEENIYQSNAARNDAFGIFSFSTSKRFSDWAAAISEQDAGSCYSSSADDLKCLFWFALSSNHASSPAHAVKISQAAVFEYQPFRETVRGTPLRGAATGTHL